MEECSSTYLRWYPEPSLNCMVVLPARFEVIIDHDRHWMIMSKRLASRLQDAGTAKSTIDENKVREPS